VRIFLVLLLSCALVLVSCSDYYPVTVISSANLSGSSSSSGGGSILRNTTYMLHNGAGRHSSGTLFYIGVGRFTQAGLGSLGVGGQMPCTGSVVSTAFHASVSGYIGSGLFYYACSIETTGGVSTLGSISTAVTGNGFYHMNQTWNPGFYTFSEGDIYTCSDSYGLGGRWTTDNAIGTLLIECWDGG